MTSDELINIVGENVDRLDDCIQAAGGGELTLETKDYLCEIMLEELRCYIPEPESNVLKFPGMKNVM